MSLKVEIWPLDTQKPVKRQGWWKGKFILDASNGEVGVRVRVGRTPVHKPTLPPYQQSVNKSFFWGRGIHVETVQSSLTAILKLVIGGLTGPILVVLSTVILQFQGQFVSVSLRPILQMWQLMSWLQSDHHVCVCVLSHVWNPAKFPCPWNVSSKITGVGCHFFLLGIFLTQGSNLPLLCLLHWQVDSLPLVPPELTSSTWWGFQYLQDSSERIIFKSPWRGTKCPWLCLMTRLFLLSLLGLFSFVSAFFHFSG